MRSPGKKLTYANVVATLALALAVAGGTAFAATQMLPKNSVGSAQLKKAAVTPAKLSAASKQTLTGPAGPTGPQGKEGPPGKQGEPGPAVQILPSGQTEAGVWGGDAGTGGSLVVVINFIPRLQQPVPAANQDFLAVGQTNGNCPGFGQAAAGYLCVYAVWAHEATFGGFLSGYVNSVGAASNETGTLFYMSPSGAGANARGNWAYTQP